MISFHTAAPGKYTLKAKTPVKWTMVYPEKHVYAGKRAVLAFNVSGPVTCIFMIDP